MGSGAYGDLRSLRILVVDDNFQMRTILGSVLIGAGVTNIHYATNGLEALKVMMSASIDLAYVDHDMPGGDGLEFVSKVRDSDSAFRMIPIIMVTAHSDMRRLINARDRGVNEFLRKPVTARSILDRLNSVVFHPRPFVISPAYIGPDRRRKRATPYEGKERRRGGYGGQVRL